MVTRSGWRLAAAIYLIIGVLGITACISISISDGGSAESGYNSERDTDIGDKTDGEK